MKTPALDLLLDKLCCGDNAAAERAFLEYEPYLRKVVRRLLPQRLRSKFDSVDIVQSAWSDLLQGFRDSGWRFTDTEQLRAFLVRVTRNRFIDRYREHDPAARQEERLPDRSYQQLQGAPANPSAYMQASDLWRRLQALCPPEYLPILRMKHEGVPLEEIATRTGLHPGSIRRILRNLAAQVADQVP